MNLENLKVQELSLEEQTFIEGGCNICRNVGRAVGLAVRAILEYFE